MSMTQSLFAAFVLGMAGAVVSAVFGYQGARRAIGVLAALGIWFTYVALMFYFGILQRANARPPGMLFILGPVVTYLVAATLVMASSRGAIIAAAFPLSLVIALQAFRVIVELFIHRLWVDGVVPQVLTFSGANVDIYIGLSAPIVAMLAARHRKGPTIALIWNALGVLALANVVTRAVLAAPGPFNFLHTNPPNGMFGTFPFMFIPAFFVPLAVTLHLLSLRANWIRRHVKTSDKIVEVQT